MNVHFLKWVVRKKTASVKVSSANAVGMFIFAALVVVSAAVMEIITGVTDATTSTVTSDADQMFAVMESNISSLMALMLPALLLFGVMLPMMLPIIHAVLRMEFDDN